MSKKVVVNIDEEMFLPCYRPLLTSTANINFLWGGRDSGKSYFIAEKLIVDCLSLKYFRCILIKKTAESIKDSQWQLIKDICESWGIAHLFNFNVSPLTITCVNGNRFIARGCDKPEKLKSISNPSHAWYEEGNQLTEADYIVATTTLRSNLGPVQEWFSFNPECDEADYSDFWLFKNFFKEAYERGEFSFTGNVTFDLPNGTKFTRTYTSTHTTYHNNLQYCSPDRIANHESLKRTNAYYYTVFTLGLWGKRNTGGEVLKCFKRNIHVGKVPYNPALALHLSFDENVVPYFPCGIFQIDGNKWMMIDCIAARHPNNKVKWMASEIKRRYHSHDAGMFIYGDATSQKDDVKQEKGHDLFRLIIDELKDYKPSRRIAKSNPSVVMSLNFFNEILELNYGGIEFMMDEKCHVAIRDFENTKEASDGGIDKRKITDKETGQSYQPFGHFVDLTRYKACYAYSAEYADFQRKGKKGQYSGGQNSSANNW